MKTNQLMIRKMGEFDVVQRTKDGFFKANALLKQWNLENEKSKKQVKDFLRLDKTVEFVEVLAKENNPKTSLSECYIGHQTVPNKVLNVYEKSRGINGGTWMHPYLFIDFAMWINPKFKLQVIKFVYDEMIKYRKDAGNAYKELGGAVGKLVEKDFMPQAMKKVSKALNFIVFNKHETGIRNKYGIEEKQRDLFQLEKKITDLINEGFINSYEDLIGYLRKQWKSKNTPEVFLN